MHDLEVAILETFKRRPTDALSTTELVQHVLPDAFQEAEVLLHSPDKQHRRRGKQKKARLHRKLLYHINKLAEEQILMASGTLEHGEKLFSLALREGDVEIRSGKKRILIHKPSRITTPIDQYGEAGSVLPYHRDDWLHKVNAVLLESERFDSLADASEAINKALEHVNDTVGLLRLESLLDAKVDQMEEFLTLLEQYTTSYQKRVMLVVVLSRVEDENKLARFCRTFCAFKPKQVELIMNITPKTLIDYKEFFIDIIPRFARAEIKLNLKNSALHLAPVIYGNAGPYTLTAEDWRAYQHVRHEGAGCCIAGSALAIDLARAQRIHELGRKAAEALFLVGVQRRRGFEQHLTGVRALGVNFAFVDEYLRFWNYDIRSGEETFITELQATRDVLDEFCNMQERVYRACGMPIRYRVQMSSAFWKFGALSARQYRKMTVRGLATLQEESFVDVLRVREQLCSIFSGDRVRFFRSHGKAEDILRELSFLFTFSLPFVTYDFSALRGDVKLTSFFGGAS